MAIPNSKEKERKSIPESIDWFQLLDRAFCINDSIEANLIDQRALELSPKLKKKIEQAQELILDVYMEAAHKYFGTNNNSSYAKIAKPKSNKTSKRIRKKS